MSDSAEESELHLQNKELAQKLDEISQEVYGLRSRAAVSERLQTEYQTELDSQHEQINDLKASHASEILKLKDEHFKIVQSLESKLIALETENQDIVKKHAIEKEEFIKIKKELRDFHNESPVAALKAELQECQEEHAANRVACVQHQDLNKILLREKSDLLEELRATKEHLEITEEKMKILKNDFMELAENHEELKESYAVLQSELSCLKAAPTEDVGRGNSIFAEVEDRRQAMLSKCSTLAKKYNDMKNDYSAKCKEISKLKSEVAFLRRQMLDELEERDNKDVWLKDNYEIRIKELLETIEDLKRKEKPVFLSGDSKILKYSHNIIEEAKKEMVELRKEMERRSSQRLNEAKALYIARTELLALRAQAMSVHAENLVLRDTLESANITDIPSPSKTLENLKDILNNCGKDLDPFRLKTVPFEINQEPESAGDNPPCQSGILISTSPAQGTSFKTELTEEASYSEFPDEVLSNDISKEDPGTVLNESTPIEISSRDIVSSAVSPSESFSCQTSQGTDVLSTLVIPSLPTASLPKPSRLIKLEMMENIQSENTSSTDVKEPSHLEMMEKINSASGASVEHEVQKDIELLPPPPPVVEFYDENFAFRNENLEVLSSNCVGSSSCSSGLKTTSYRESPELIQTSLIKPITCVSTDKENNGAERESNDFAAEGYGHATVFKESDEDNEQHGTGISLVPTRSILAKPPRPSLLPLDQNSLGRKVRFAENDPPVEGESEQRESVVKQSLNKKPLFTRKLKYN